MGIKTVARPPYSLDLVPGNFWLFPKPRRYRYGTIEEIKETVTKVIDTLTQEDFHGTFQKLLDRYNKCIAAEGDYFEGDKSFVCVLSIKVPIRTMPGNDPHISAMRNANSLVQDLNPGCSVHWPRRWTSYHVAQYQRKNYLHAFNHFLHYAQGELHGFFLSEIQFFYLQIFTSSRLVGSARKENSSVPLFNRSWWMESR